MQGDWVGVATALSPATVGHFKFLFHLLFVGLGLGVMRDDAFHGLEHAREGLLEVIGQDQDFVRRLLRESPRSVSAPLRVVLPLFLMQL